MTTRPILPRAVAELIGTMTLVLVGCTATYMTDFPRGNYGTFGIAVVHGAAYAIMLGATLGISGGYLNPAISIALAVIRRLSWRDAGYFVAAQLIGAIIAGFLAKWLFAPNVGYLRAFGTPMVLATLLPIRAIMMETLLTFMLMSAVMGLRMNGKISDLGGAVVGLMVIPLMMVGAPFTGAAMNPARFVGPSVASQVFTSQTVYWIGPVLGAVLAALVWEYVVGVKDEG